MRIILVQRIWSRSQWNAVPPKNSSLIDRLSDNVENVSARKATVSFDCANIVSRLTSALTSNTTEKNLQNECLTVVKNQQKYDLKDSTLNDISYNFLIGNEGIFEGRGWNIQPNSKDINSLTCSKLTSTFLRLRTPDAKVRECRSFLFQEFFRDSLRAKQAKTEEVRRRKSLGEQRKFIFISSEFIFNSDA